MSHLQHPVWVAGASGLIGRALLTELARQPVQVHALLRRAQDLTPGLHLQLHLIDHQRADLGGGLPAPEAVFIALGTTIAQAGSEAAFRAVDLDAVVNVARAARVMGARRCAVVSALGADTGSAVFYNRVKGEMEEALRSLHFAHLLIARPSLLLGDRTQLDQPGRSGERWAQRLSGPLGGLIPKRWRPIAAERVARAMVLALAQSGPAVHVLESAQLQDLGTS
ncbi:NAD(P)H-binding protein [Paucibacter sp. APW11]|uniref:NAD(P)H-binding protein n=1 Tax=Roseateles aquae TaxID=3077235 RepID=A0ABU3P9G6_9BURK|nr:NAD(P)H-binding protein [Paucibacter sp. APW11]MDT8998932.1 NAD(P)H-binding protein [Paucibacter sp. APW11]